MRRRDFIKNSMFGAIAMTSLSDLKKFSDGLARQENKMPIMFVGHGSPMNAIEDNEFTKEWVRIGKNLVKPSAIVSISAHWFTKGTFVTSMENPETIHDFYGFPKELFDVEYPAKGNPALANQTKEIIHNAEVILDKEWGLDHGTWSVLRRMYPEADIPIIQLSIDYTKDAHWHFELAKELEVLRNKGVLILGSGNIVHNLRLVNWKNPDEKYDWAEDMNSKFKENILSNEFSKLINYNDFGSEAKLAIPTPDHYFPMLYILGLKQKNEEVLFFNDKTVLGSVSMTSFMTL
ncbi:MAG: 4,5-DOPA dioxygenase extradiol [Ignavibacteriaceae bacterium]